MIKEELLKDTAAKSIKDLIDILGTSITTEAKTFRMKRIAGDLIESANYKEEK